MDAEFKTIKDIALRYLAKKSRSTGEIRAYLLNEAYSPDLVDKVLKYLAENKYTDDLNYAKDFARKKNLQGQGKNKIFNQLLVRGIGKEVLGEIEKEYSYDMEYLRANSLIEKKFGKDIDRENIPKAIRFLYNRGYTSGTIKKLFNDYC